MFGVSWFGVCSSCNTNPKAYLFQFLGGTLCLWLLWRSSVSDKATHRSFIISALILGSLPFCQSVMEVHKLSWFLRVETFMTKTRICRADTAGGHAIWRPACCEAHWWLGRHGQRCHRRWLPLQLKFLKPHFGQSWLWEACCCLWQNLLSALHLAIQWLLSIPVSSIDPRSSSLDTTPSTSVATYEPDYLLRYFCNAFFICDKLMSGTFVNLTMLIMVQANQEMGMCLMAQTITL